MKRILAGGWIGLKRRLQKMKDIDALLKNLCSIYVTVVKLTGMKRQALNKCKVVIYLLVSFPVQDFCLCLQFTFLAVHIYQIQGRILSSFPLRPAGHQRLDSLDRRTARGQRNSVQYMYIIKEEAKIAIIVSGQSICTLYLYTPRVLGPPHRTRLFYSWFQIKLSRAEFRFTQIH